MTLQKDWAKTQVRLPPDLHPLIKDYAKDNDLSMNSAFVQLLKKGLNASSSNTDEFDIFIRGLEKIIPGMQVNDTSMYLVELVNAWKAKNKKPT